MRLTVNGSERDLAEGSTLGDLLRTLGLVEGRVAVELNREILRRESFDRVRLGEGDQVEIVRLVGGG